MLAIKALKKCRHQNIDKITAYAILVFDLSKLQSFDLSK